MNEKPSIPQLSRRIHHGLHCLMNKHLEKHNIGWRQMKILFILNDEGSLNQNMLSKHFNIDKAVITNSLKLLIAEGYVVRKKHSDDKRRFEISITEKGKEVVPALREAMVENKNLMLNGLSDENIDILQSLMIQVLDNIEEELAREGR